MNTDALINRDRGANVIKASPFLIIVFDASCILISSPRLTMAMAHIELVKVDACEVRVNSE